MSSIKWFDVPPSCLQCPVFILSLMHDSLRQGLRVGQACVCHFTKCLLPLCSISLSASLLQSGNRYQHIGVISYRLSERDRFCLSFLPAHSSILEDVCMCVRVCVYMYKNVMEENLYFSHLHDLAKHLHSIAKVL